MGILESLVTKPGSDPAAAASFTRASVLVIDDEEIVGNTLGALIEAEGLSAVIARSGQEGVDLLRGGQFEVVIADLRMPGMDGIQTIAALKEIDPDIEVIVLTGYATVESTIAALRQGAGDFLLKPIGKAQLRPALLRALKKRRGGVVRAQAHTRAVIGAAPEAIILFDREGVVREFNPQSEQIFGWPREQAVGRKLADLVIPPRLLEEFRRHVEAASRQGKCPLNGSVEVVGLRKNGEEFPFEISTTVIETPQGKLLSTFGRDITERKQALKAAQGSESKIPVVLDGVDTGIFLIDPETHQIVDANPLALKLVGARRELVIGAKCHKFICSADQGRCPVTDLGQKVDNSERVLLTVTGERLPVIKTVRPVVLSGRRLLVESFVDTSGHQRAEEALRESEDRYRDLVENSFFLIGTHDAKGRILGLNRAAAELMEATNAKEMVGRPLTDYVPPDLLPQFAQYLETILREGHAEGPMVIATPSGKVKVVEYRNTLRRQDPEEPIIRMVGQDVTEKIEAEKAQAFLASLVESSQDAIIGVTLEGVVLSWNHGAEDLYGYSAKEMMRKPISVLFPPEHLDELSQHLEKIRRGESFSGYESIWVRKDGRRADVLLTLSPVFDATGKITSAVGIGHDIAERKQAERALEERTAYFETLVAATPLGIVVIDDQGCVEMCNPAFETLFQYSQADIKGCNLTDLIAPVELLPESRDLVRRVLSGYITSITTRRRRRDGLGASVLRRPRGRHAHAMPAAGPASEC